MSKDWTQMAIPGLGGLILGAFLGGTLAGGPDLAALERRIGADTAEALAGTQAAIEARLGAVETAATAAQAAAAAVQTELAGIPPSFAAMKSEIDTALHAAEEVHAAALADLQARLIALESAVAAAASVPAAAVAAAVEPAAPAASEAAPAPDAEPATTEVAADGEAVGFAAGETAVLLDGAARVFVSRVDDAAGAATVAINGQARIALAAGEGVAVSVEGAPCVVTLAAVDRGHADLTAACAGPADTAALPEGFRPGETAVLLDGKLRVFVSRVDDAGGAAILAVNGQDRATVLVGESLEADIEGAACAVTIDAVDRGHVRMTASCEG